MSEEIKQKADVYDMLREDYGIKGSLAEFVDWQASEISKLQQRLDAVVSENAALKNFINKDCCVYRNGMVVNAEAYLPDAAATDAILNRVRADAVNHAGKMIMAIMNHQDKGVERALECLAQVEMGYILAAQLRTAAPKGDSDEA